MGTFIRGVKQAGQTRGYQTIIKDGQHQEEDGKTC